MPHMSRPANVLQRVEEFLAKAFLLASTLIVFAGGVGRFLGHPLDWSIDLATFTFAWAVFLGGDLALRENRHVAVENLEFRPPVLPVQAGTGVSFLNRDDLAHQIYSIPKARNATRSRA